MLRRLFILLDSIRRFRTGPRQRSRYALALAVLAVMGAFAWAIMRSSCSPVDAHGADNPGAQVTSASSPANLRELAELPAVAAGLKTRLQQQPDDADGWALLARTYSKLGQYAEARLSYQRALEYRRGDPTLLAEYADARAFLNNGRFDGEPQDAIDEALRIDSSNRSALMLAGLSAYDLRDFKSAVRYWEKLARTSAPEDSQRLDIERALAEARDKVKSDRSQAEQAP
jgi:cytochrome c-type biogenesis protein CcmH